MMPMMKCGGLFAVIPVTLLLTVSFFVLMAIKRAETERLKIFGYVIAALLWVSAALVSCSALSALTGIECPVMKSMMKCHMRGGPQCHSMMKGGMEQPPMVK